MIIGRAWDTRLGYIPKLNAALLARFRRMLCPHKVVCKIVTLSESMQEDRYRLLTAGRS